MILEAALAIGLASGADAYSTDRMRGRVWCRPEAPTECAPYLDRSRLCAASSAKCWAAAGAYTAVGTVVTHKVERKWGRRAGWASVVTFAVVPTVAAVLNSRKGRRP